MMGWYGNGWGNGWGMLMGLPMLLIWIVIIIGIAYLVKVFFRNEGRYNNNKTPMEILNERYAKGEISDDDYDRMKNKLEIR